MTNDKMRFGVYENIDKSRFVHFTTGVLPGRLRDGDVLVGEYPTLSDAKKASGLATPNEKES